MADAATAGMTPEEFEKEAKRIIRATQDACWERTKRALEIYGQRGLGTLPAIAEAVAPKTIIPSDWNTPEATNG